jgi:hypothetical protein
VNHARHDNDEDDACMNGARMDDEGRKPGQQPTMKAARGIRAWAATGISFSPRTLLHHTVLDVPFSTDHHIHACAVLYCAVLYGPFHSTCMHVSRSLVYTVVSTVGWADVLFD